MLTLSSSSQQEFSEYLVRKETCEAWKQLGTETEDGLEIHHLELSPLEWPRKGGILKKPWEQKLMVFKPANVQSKMALLVVSSDSARSWDLEGLKTARHSKLMRRRYSHSSAQSTIYNCRWARIEEEDDLMAYTWN